ncbi:rhomboid family intramembrane serine protease [Candidatus Neomarinimicrobiota bacterium]
MRYQFQSHQTQLSWKPSVFTEAIKILIWTNIGLFLLRLTAINQFDIVNVFGLSSGSIWPMIWQPITYMFMHGGFWHVAINMFVLWMFGSELEFTWGRKNFLKYYFITGIGSGMIWLILNIGNPQSVLIGASGAIYGILMAYGLMFPNRTVYLYFLFPIKVKWFVIFIGAVAFFSSMNDASNISHITHLSGMIIGYLYLNTNSNWKKLKFNFRKLIIEFKTEQKVKTREKKQGIEREINKILEKINEVGFDNLTKNERETLERSSRQLSHRKEKD